MPTMAWLVIVMVAVVTEATVVEVEVGVGVGVRVACDAVVKLPPQEEARCGAVR
jgi:hypothetical protein